jgi:hypothetical protein
MTVPKPGTTKDEETISYCGRDKGVPNGWSFNWQQGEGELETLCRKLARSPHVCVCPCYVDAKRQHPPVTVTSLGGFQEFHQSSELLGVGPRPVA